MHGGIKVHSTLVPEIIIDNFPHGLELGLLKQKFTFAFSPSLCQKKDNSITVLVIVMPNTLHDSQLSSSMVWDQVKVNTMAIT